MSDPDWDLSVYCRIRTRAIGMIGALSALRAQGPQTR